MPTTTPLTMAPASGQPPLTPDTSGRGPDHAHRPVETALFTVCAVCTALTAADDVIVTLAGDRICDSCATADYWRCPDCGGWNPDGYTCGNYCDDEDEDDDEEDVDDTDDTGLVHDYSYKPTPVFHGQGSLFLGLELEVATPHGRSTPARLAADGLGRLGYLKADDSIGGGFEIVTHPMSYPWALTHFPWPLLPALADAGCQATDRTGMHVHLSRDGFDGPAHIYRWMKFVYRNQPAVTALARRDSHQWAQFDDNDRHRVLDYAKGTRGHFRYRAINTTNRDTFELRVFAATLHPAHVQAALGFAAATVDYTRTLTIPTITHHDGWTWTAFTDWLTQRPSYNPLAEQAHALATARIGNDHGSSPCAC